MAEQSASRLSGDDYQHLYSWYELLQLLPEESPYDQAYLEHPEAGAADDITFSPKQDASASKRFVQVKWHVTYGDQYSFDSLTTITSGARSLLKKLFDSWKTLRGDGEVEVWLVSNWSPKPGPDLGSYLGRGRRLTDEFFTKRAPSPAAVARQRWAEALGTTEAEVIAFCRDLRFELGYHDIDRFNEQFDDRMARYGLSMGENARAIVLDEISKRIQRGGEAKRIHRHDIVEIIERRGLRAYHPQAPAVRLWIHGWARQGYDAEPTVELDWTHYFDREKRRVASPKEWIDTLLPQLRAARERLTHAREGKYIDMRGKLPLTAALAVGAAFPEVAGFSLRTEQPAGGETHLWRSDSPPSELSFRITKEEGTSGQDLVLGLGMTGRGLTDMERFKQQIGASALIYAEPEGGAGPTSLRNAGDAVALARSAKELIRKLRERYSPSRVHLILYGPASFALFFGQVLNAVGTIVTYERTVEGGYQESITLHTG